MTTSSLNEVCHNHHIGEVKHINNRLSLEPEGGAMGQTEQNA